MDFKGLIEALEKFFLDIIGTLVPGIAALTAAVTLCPVSFVTLRLPDYVRAYSPLCGWPGPMWVDTQSSVLGNAG
jgi:hypothetical protein